MKPDLICVDRDSTCRKHTIVQLYMNIFGVFFLNSDYYFFFLHLFSPLAIHSSDFLRTYCTVSRCKVIL